MKKENCCANPRLNKVGGEAVIDGVMMKAGEQCSTAVRTPKGAIRVLTRKFESVRTKNKFLNLPIIRGVVNFIETMKLSISVLNDSAEIFVEEETPKKDGKKDAGMGIATTISAFFGILLALVLFIYLPNLASGGIEALFKIDLGPWKAITSGVIKVIIFVLYIWLVGFMPDIRRTFEYHGAEHKSIACFESGEELTPANAKRHSRFHPRCGTSFMFVMILLGMLLSLVVRIVLEIGFHVDFALLTENLVGKNLENLVYSLIGILILPLAMGLGYEFLMYAGKHSDAAPVRALSAPGLWMQRLTTHEPSEAQLEVAIVALKHALAEEFPDFDRAAYEAESGYLAPVVEAVEAVKPALPEEE